MIKAKGSGSIEILCKFASVEGKDNVRKTSEISRTPHVIWSPGRSKDDMALDSIEHLERLDDAVVTEKLDGENTTLYHNYLHARSIDSKSHPSKRLDQAISCKNPV